jgi:hypothetical protein
MKIIEQVKKSKPAFLKRCLFLLSLEFYLLENILILGTPDIQHCNFSFLFATKYQFHRQSLILV